MDGVLKQLIGGLQVLLTGGPMFFPLLFLSLTGMALFLEKRAELKRERNIPPEYIARIYRLIEGRRYDIAEELCKNRPMLVTDLLRTGIESRALGERELSKALRERLHLRGQAVYNNLPLLGMVASAAPILGLLGTVIGMLISFGALSMGGDAEQLKIVADGIGTALLTTFGGLAVAAPTYIAHRYLLNQADQLIREVRRYGVELARFLQAEETYNPGGAFLDEPADERLDESGAERSAGDPEDETEVGGENDTEDDPASEETTVAP